MGPGASVVTLLSKVNAMLKPTTSNLPDTFHRLSRRPDEPSTAKPEQARRPKASRSMRARRTALIMVGFGLLLGCVELIIVLSYL